MQKFSEFLTEWLNIGKTIPQVITPSGETRDPRVPYKVHVRQPRETQDEPVGKEIDPATHKRRVGRKRPKDPFADTRLKRVAPKPETHSVQQRDHDVKDKEEVKVYQPNKKKKKVKDKYNARDLLGMNKDSDKDDAKDNSSKPSDSKS